MANRDIASASRLLRLRPALSLHICAEFPGGFLVQGRDLVLIYLVIPFGWNGAPANFAIFGDAITCSQAKFGTGGQIGSWIPLSVETICGRWAPF